MNFSIRVYGILTYNKQVLVTDEYRFGRSFTKFPGGGLEFGEGTIACLVREFKEELDLEIRVIEHFYTTDFFQASAFHSKTQILSIYYLVKCEHPEMIPVTKINFDFPKEEGAQSFRWLNINTLQETDLTFPIDRKVAVLLQSQASNLR
ncbi:MAG: NUDIX domain-containing protein [Flavobacteriales bacterium]